MPPRTAPPLRARVRRRSRLGVLLTFAGVGATVVRCADPTTLTSARAKPRADASQTCNPKNFTPNTCCPPDDYVGDDVCFIANPIGPTGPSADSLGLRTSPNSGVRDGDYVTFQAFTAKGAAFQVVTWTWVPAAGAKARTNPSSCLVAINCKLPVYESGTMTVTATVNGATETATATVVVTPCAGASDPWVGDPQVRRQLLDALAYAQQHGYNEVGGDGGVSASDNSKTLRTIPSSIAPSTCSYNQDYKQAPAFPAGYSQTFVEWHVHAYGPGDQGTGCTQAATATRPAVTPDQTATFGPGPSDADWTHSLGANRVGYVIQGGSARGGPTTIWRYNSARDGTDAQFASWTQDAGSACFVAQPGNAPAYFP